MIYLRFFSEKLGSEAASSRWSSDSIPLISQLDRTNAEYARATMIHLALKRSYNHRDIHIAVSCQFHLLQRAKIGQ
jgi:hypothetical protein